MSEKYPDDLADHIVLDRDLLGPNKKAENLQQRRQVLDHAIGRAWLNRDIGRIERHEPATGHWGYRAWWYKP